MGCQCKVNQQLEYLQKHYGMIDKKRHNTNIGETVLSVIKSGIMSILLLPLLPIGLAIIIFPNNKGSISIKKLFKLNKDDRSK